MSSTVYQPQLVKEKDTTKVISKGFKYIYIIMMIYRTSLPNARSPYRVPSITILLLPIFLLLINLQVKLPDILLRDGLESRLVIL